MEEYEMEVMRDYKDQCVVICSIENFDPMGVHTGDSITIAPAMTLSDKEYQLMRDASFACIREIGVETGGSNIQFSTNPENGRMVVIEMNPRVPVVRRLHQKPLVFLSPNSQPNWPWVTRWMIYKTMLPRKLPHVLSHRLIMLLPRFPVSHSRNFLTRILP